MYYFGRKHYKRNVLPGRGLEDWSAWAQMPTPGAPALFRAQFQRGRTLPRPGLEVRSRVFIFLCKKDGNSSAINSNHLISLQIIIINNGPLPPIALGAGYRSEEGDSSRDGLHVQRVWIHAKRGFPMAPSFWKFVRPYALPVRTRCLGFFSEKGNQFVGSTSGKRR